VPPPAAIRLGAIVQASVFDAVNGIDPQYTAIHVAPAGPAFGVASGNPLS